MASHRVTYNISGKIFESWCNDGILETFFVFPPMLKDGDKLPSLLMHVPGEKSAFKLNGGYNAESEELEFIFNGPLGYVYKLSISVDARKKSSQTWMANKQGVTSSPVDYSEAMLYVPRQICVREATSSPSTRDILMKPAGGGRLPSDSLCSLKLCITVAPARLSRRQEMLRSAEDVGVGFFHRQRSRLFHLRATSCGDSSSRFTELEREEEEDDREKDKEGSGAIKKAKTLVKQFFRNTKLKE